MNNFNSTMGGANSIYPKTTSPSYFNPTYGQEQDHIYKRYKKKMRGIGLC